MIVEREIFMKKAVLLSILGAVLYILLGAIAPFAVQPTVSPETVSSVRDTDFYGDTPCDERVMLVSDNGDALAERIRLISQAQERIILSTFDFRSDESGKQVLAALHNAVKRGVQVQVLVDGNAAAMYLTGNPWFRALSAMTGAEIRIYNPLNPLTPWKIMGRLHDKYLIADDTAYILGGRNTYDYFLGDQPGYKNLDLDLLVWGGGASHIQLTGYFEDIWASPLCHIYHNDPNGLQDFSVSRAAGELDALYTAMMQEHPDWFAACDYEAKTMPANKIQLVTNPIHCYAKEPLVFYTVTQLMQQGRENVYFHTPYIIANKWMTGRLADICAAVPQVAMMTNAPANNANPFGAMDYLRHKEEILETGVTILEYDGGASYHGKCFAVDDRLSGIGSFNWDMRSTYLDTEMMLIVDSGELNTALRTYMEGFEEHSLAVVDADNAIAPPGHSQQEMPFLQNVILGFLQIFGSWARFLF